MSTHFFFVIHFNRASRHTLAKKNHKFTRGIRVQRFVKNLVANARTKQRNQEQIKTKKSNQGLTALIYPNPPPRPSKGRGARPCALRRAFGSESNLSVGIGRLGPVCATLINSLETIWTLFFLCASTVKSPFSAGFITRDFRRYNPLFFLWFVSSAF